MQRATQWLLTAAERNNGHTRIDSRHVSGDAWTAGNEVRALIHGASYFPELLRCVRAMAAGDLLLFTDWRGDPDQRLDGPDTEVSRVLCEAATRGVLIKGLVWRSHLDRLSFSEQENRHLGEEINAAGGEVLRDMRVRPDGSHHQKFVVLRHPGRPEMDVAFVGGIDLCHSRGDDDSHSGDAQRQPMAKVYGDRPPWHDAQLAIRGPAVGDVEAVFRERWEDPAPLNRNPIDRLSDRFHGEDRVVAGPLPEQLPDPAPCGQQTIQLLRTYPKRRQGYPFAPEGERSIARGYQRAASLARRLIYLEDQYLWSPAVVACFAKTLRANPNCTSSRSYPVIPTKTVAGRCRPILLAACKRLIYLERPAATGWPCTDWKTETVSRCTSTPKSASSTTPGALSDLAISTAAPGPTIPNCPAWLSATIGIRTSDRLLKSPQ